ncbi:hypothetical protein LCGC14_1342250 [marine sediment metagenome]|uniref:Uncharacterized protein n=1 Tax=marine sediment metagenome TaxID=412755 RepID=A0A0F9KZR4_9ZZZZ
MQAPDGAMVAVTEKQFDVFNTHGAANLCRVGDVFKIRHCHFEVETISECGISAKGISRHEYFDKKKRQMP